MTSLIPKATDEFIWVFVILTDFYSSIQLYLNMMSQGSWNLSMVLDFSEACTGLFYYIISKINMTNSEWQLNDNSFDNWLRFAQFAEFTSITLWLLNSWLDIQDGNKYTLTDLIIHISNLTLTLLFVFLKRPPSHA